MMKKAKYLGLLGALALLVGTGLFAHAHAFYGRQYYGGWTYYPSRSYYYSSYYYQPYSGYSGYQYNYCIYYPSQPSYVYYYNQYSGHYWGRLDLTAKDENKYSLLKEEDRKATLKEIPESAFPKPGKMPDIPGSKDNTAMLPIDPADLPKVEQPKK
jgi:hypothetical protein